MKFSEKIWLMIILAKSHKKAGLHPLSRRCIFGKTIEGGGQIYKVSANISGERHKAPEEIWLLGGGIEIPCKYFLYGPVIHKTFIRNEL